METNEKTYNKLPVYELKINMETETEVNYISLVENPAIQVDWVAFSGEEKKQSFKVLDEEKRILLGAFMIPDLPIYRRNENTGEEYYVVMSKETIETAVKKFFKQRYSDNINMEHNLPVAGAYVVESWFVADPKKDKSALYGFNLPVGSWVGSVFVEDKEIWNEYVKTGKIKGFSVEGLFAIGELSDPNKIENSEHFTKEELSFISEVANYLLS